MRRLMGAAALAAMLIAGQGVSAQALEQDRNPILKDGIGQPKIIQELTSQPGLIAEGSVGSDAGCGNGGLHGDPGASGFFNEAGDDTTLDDCAGTPQSEAAPE